MTGPFRAVCSTVPPSETTGPPKIDILTSFVKLYCLPAFISYDTEKQQLPPVPDAVVASIPFRQGNAHFSHFRIPQVSLVLIREIL